MKEFNQEYIIGLFKRVSIYDDVTARSELGDLFRLIGPDHPLTREFSSMIKDYDIMEDVKDGD